MRCYFFLLAFSFVYPLSIPYSFKNKSYLFEFSKDDACFKSIKQLKDLEILIHFEACKEKFQESILLWARKNSLLFWECNLKDGQFVIESMIKFSEIREKLPDFWGKFLIHPEAKIPLLAILKPIGRETKIVLEWSLFQVGNFDLTWFANHVTKETFVDLPNHSVAELKLETDKIKIHLKTIHLENHTPK